MSIKKCEEALNQKNDKHINIIIQNGSIQILRDTQGWAAIEYHITIMISMSIFKDLESIKSFFGQQHAVLGETSTNTPKKVIRLCTARDKL